MAAYLAKKRVLIHIAIVLTETRILYSQDRLQLL